MSFRKTAALCAALCLTASMTACGESTEDGEHGYGWTDEMLEMKDEVKRLTSENPVRDIYGGLPTDYANLVSDTINQPLHGNDRYSVRDEAYDVIDLGVNEANDQVAKLQ